MFRPQIRSRHPSHSGLRDTLERLPFKSIIRFGSTTEVTDGIKRIELNSPKAIEISSNKLLMKQAFQSSGVRTADWWTTSDGTAFWAKDNKLSIKDLPYPIVAKKHYGSRGEGNSLLHTQGELTVWIKGKTLSHYIFEKFYNFDREYRLHINSDGCYYTCRKMLKSGSPEDAKWFRNDSNCVWYLESNSLFDKPVNWDSVVKESVKALDSAGLDFGAVDLRIQSAKDKKGRVREDPEFIVVEINSAPSLNDSDSVVFKRYLEVLPIMLKKKFLKS